MTVSVLQYSLYDESTITKKYMLISTNLKLRHKREQSNRASKNSIRPDEHQVDHGETSPVRA